MQKLMAFRPNQISVIQVVLVRLQFVLTDNYLNNIIFHSRDSIIGTKRSACVRHSLFLILLLLFYV